MRALTYGVGDEALELWFEVLTPRSATWPWTSNLALEAPISQSGQSGRETPADRTVVSVQSYGTRTFECPMNSNNLAAVRGMAVCRASLAFAEAPCGFKAAESGSNKTCPKGIFKHQKAPSPLLLKPGSSLAISVSQSEGLWICSQDPKVHSKNF